MLSAGQYLVTLTGINPVSTETISMNYTIDTPIRNPRVTTNLPSNNNIVILRMESIIFTVDMDSGK